MEILILLFVIVIGTSFLCSVLESVLLSTNASYISVLEKNNPTAGKLLKKLKTTIYFRDNFYIFYHYHMGINHCDQS